MNHTFILVDYVIIDSSLSVTFNYLSIIYTDIKVNDEMVLVLDRI